MNISKVLLCIAFLANFSFLIAGIPCGSYLELLGENCDIQSIRIVGMVEKGKAVVTFLEDSSGRKFCVKQLQIDRTRTQGSFFKFKP